MIKPNKKTNKVPNRKIASLTAFLLIILSGVTTGTTIYATKMGLDPLEFYGNLANPYMRLVSIPAGLRREQIADKFAKVLNWDDKEIEGFLTTAPSDENGYLDGYYAPGAYWVEVGASGVDVAHKMLRSFNSKVSEQIFGEKKDIKNGTIGVTSTASAKTKKINLDTAVKIASLIEREAGSKSDMKIISGVIWNRIFSGMSLDIDATLQYAKGTEEKWWPVVTGKDKYIASEFNTYKNKGLPPMAISNPSMDAIKAAFNPTKTDCLFYLHDTRGVIHCTKTYAAHKQNVQKYLIGKK